ncbi:unnamed protein product [Phytomonas sp. Hart1]|nr:unnamed protein product [Phytomonas sp. Hart1]|eukprot:CCW69385.1 unnamed protein product [Phytomonas sp. isolate Hart1]
MQLVLEDSVLYIPVSTCLLVCIFFILVRVVANFGFLSFYRKTTLNGTWALGIQTAIIVLLLTCHADSGLLVLLSSFSLTIAFLVCTSARGFFSVFVLAFMVLSMWSTPVLSYATTVRIRPPSPSSRQRSIVSSYNGENVQLKVEGNDFHKIDPWSMYIFHADFFLINDIPPLLKVPSVTEVPSHDRTRLREVISVGERTRISGLAGVQTLVLVGEGSTIENSVLQCKFDADMHKNTTDVIPCLVGAARFSVINVTMQFQVKVNDVMKVCSFHVPKTESCFEVTQRYNILRDEIKGNLSVVDLPSELIRCREPDVAVSGFLKGIPISPDFYAAMPLLVALRTRLPQFIGMVQSYWSFLFKYIGIPAGKVILEAATMLDKLWRQLAVLAITMSKTSLPYLFAVLRLFKDSFEGFLYGIGTHKCESGNSDWDNGAIELGFLLGVNLREGLGVALSSASDALTVVPGLWVVIQWSLNAEWTITKTLIGGFRQGLYRTATDVLSPVAQSILSLFGAVCMNFGPLLGNLRALVYCTHTFTFLDYAYRWLFSQESRLINLELRIINVLTRCAAWVLVFIIRYSGRVFAKSCRYGLLTVKWYSSTSFFIHFFLFILQTVVLFIALRNEIRELIEYQFTAKSNKNAGKCTNHMGDANTGGMWFLGKALQKFQSHPKLNVVNGITLLARNHYQAFTAYILQHSVLWFLLVGLSVFPFTGKFYALTLHVALPWLSSKLFLNFFTSKPSHSQVAMMFGGRFVLALFLECTIGDLIRRLIKEMFFLFICSVCILLLAWAWKHHHFLTVQFLTISTKIFSAATTPATVIPLMDSEDGIIEKASSLNRAGVTQEEAG